MKIMLGATAAALLSACPLSAANADGRTVVAAHVSTTGLDLASTAGRAILDARLRRAIRQACGDSARDIHMSADVQRCQREMSADAERRVAALRRPVVVAGR